MNFTSEKISCPVAIICFFFENCFPLIPIMASTSRKIALKNKHCCDEGFVKDLLKSAFPLYGKVASTLKNLKISENIKKKKKNWCSLAGIYFVFKN